MNEKPIQQAEQSAVSPEQGLHIVHDEDLLQVTGGNQAAGSLVHSSPPSFPTSLRSVPAELEPPPNQTLRKVNSAGPLLI